MTNLTLRHGSKRFSTDHEGRLHLPGALRRYREDANARAIHVVMRDPSSFPVIGVLVGVLELSTEPSPGEDLNTLRERELSSRGRLRSHEGETDERGVCHFTVNPRSWLVAESVLPDVTRFTDANGQLVWTCDLAVAPPDTSPTEVTLRLRRVR